MGSLSHGVIVFNPKFGKYDGYSHGKVVSRATTVEKVKKCLTEKYGITLFTLDSSIITPKVISKSSKVSSPKRNVSPHVVVPAAKGDRYYEIDPTYAPVTDFILKDLNEVYTEALRIYKGRFGMLGPKVEWFEKTGKAGYAKLAHNIVGFNVEIARRVGQREFKNTVIHEIAHLVTYTIDPLAPHHGRTFKNVMANLGGIPNTFHSYDVTGLVRKVTKVRHSMKCACSEHWVTSALRSKVMHGQKYICKTCNVSIMPTNKIKEFK
jgi:predicted SprT family Zn-dependent metalloprotease